MIWYDHDWGWNWWAWALMWLGMLLFWGLAIWGIALLVRGGRRLDDAPPERVLAERYARGEIDEEEYRRRLDVLRAASDRDHLRGR